MRMRALSVGAFVGLAVLAVLCGELVSAEELVYVVDTEGNAVSVVGTATNQLLKHKGIKRALITINSSIGNLLPASPDNIKFTIIHVPGLTSSRYNLTWYIPGAKSINLFGPFLYTSQGWSGPHPS